MITEQERRELASLMNRNKVTVEDGDVLLVCRDPKDFDRAYELLQAQGREPQRCTNRRLIVCRRSRGVPK